MLQSIGLKCTPCQFNALLIARCAAFQCVCVQHADIYEGSIIRATRRLDELLQQLTSAARVVGDSELAAHIEAANLTIRRDIIFAASLYI
jgi:ATP-dependent RNA helicase DOB1